jgi:hypothetical protein
MAEVFMKSRRGREVVAIRRNGEMDGGCGEGASWAARMASRRERKGCSPRAVRAVDVLEVHAILLAALQANARSRQIGDAAGL